MTTRHIERIIDSRPTSDGAGVKLRRSIGQSEHDRVDPFLMLDEFGSDEAADYIAGFPPHPHRGFETVTYMLEGEMLHEDHIGNRGRLSSGSVQWMTAARGIIHSEMPQQEQGRMRGFQLWINLPASEKMKDPSYRDIAPEDIPRIPLRGGGTAKVIAGALYHDGARTSGAVEGISTEPTFLDVRLPAGVAFDQPVDAGHSALVYVYEGEIDVAGEILQAGRAGVLAGGDRIVASSGDSGAAFLLLAARPLGEPVVQYGPFVMNTRTEIQQALRDYRDGTLTQ